MAINTCGKGEEVVEVVDVEVDAEEDAEEEEALDVWFPPAGVIVFVTVSVTVGVVVWASKGEGGLAGEKSDFTTETTPKTTATIPRARPDLSRFLRVMLPSFGVETFDRDSSFFCSSSSTDMRFSSRPVLRVSALGC